MMSRVMILALALCGAVGSSSGSPLTEIFQRVHTSVVVLETMQKDVDPAFPGQAVTSEGLGSGVLITDDGKILTAAHVVQAADSIRVHFLDGEEIPARVLASEPAADLALLQLERRPSAAHVASLGDSDAAEVGEEIFIIGAPLGVTHSLTVGHVSARRVTDNLFGGFLPTEQLQTDAAINQGNSGGPMFNMRGEVIGIVSYIISQSGGSEGLGFVITSNMARQLLMQERRIWSGFQGRILGEQMARILNVPQETGVLVEIVADRSLASHLGLRGGTVKATFGEEEEMIVGGDILLEVLGIPVDVNRRDEIRRRMDEIESGQEIVVKVLRDGRILELRKNYYPDLLTPAAPK